MNRNERKPRNIGVELTQEEYELINDFYNTGLKEKGFMKFSGELNSNGIYLDRLKTAIKDRKLSNKLKEKILLFIKQKGLNY